MQPNTQEQRIKVLYVITKSNFGGAQRYVYDLSTALPKERFDVTVACGGTGVPGSESGRLAELLTNAHIRTIHISELGRDISLLHDWHAFRALITLCKTERPDILHLNSSKVGGLGGLAGRISGVPHIIYTAHGWAFWENRSPIVTIAIKIISWLTVALSHTTICISEFDRDNVRWMKGVQSRLRVIKNGVSPFTPLERIPARNTLFSPEQQRAHENDFWLLSIGELHANKHYLFALECVAEYNRSHDRKIFYAIIGMGEMKDAIEQYIGAHSMHSSVTLLGFIPEARTYLKAFDTLFLPSRKEGVPYVVLESGYASTPVIASNVGGIPEIIPNEQTGLLINPTDKDGVVHTLETMVYNADVRSAMARKLHERVVRLYDQQDMVTKTIDIYHTS